MKKATQFFSDFLRRADILLFLLCLSASIFGLVIIASAAATADNPLQFIIVQTGALILGIILYILFTIIDIDIIVEKWAFLFTFSIVFLMSLLIFGEEINGSRTWIRFLGIGIQPTEVVKFIYVVLMAKHISYLKSHKDLNAPFSVAQLAVHFLFMFGMITVVADDLGSALIFAFIFIIMLFVVGLQLRWFAIGIAGIAAASPILWTYFLKDYHKQRILAPYVPSIDPNNETVNYQASRSKLALASGRLTGSGLYNGTQTQSAALPEKRTDFIFAVAGEELGMIGCILIVVLLSIIIIRCVYVGIQSKNTMHMLICVGIGATIFFQTFENIGMCIGLAPVVGLTLPFFSYGGSSMFATFAAMGIVSGIRYRPKPERFRGG